MIRTYCDCCGNEVTDANSTACGNKGLGRLTAQVMPKMGGAGEVMAVEVITAHEGTWNKGHFCKYCVIDAINKLDDRPSAEPSRPDVKQMVNRFLGWKLPKTFGPDAGISFKPSNGMTRDEAFDKFGWWPVGTNLFTADEATEMFKHALGASQS